MKKFYSLIVMLMLAFTQVNAQYCIPTFPSGCTSGDRIDDFTIPSAAFSHLNSGCSAGAYGDFTSMIINLTPTVPYPFTITHSFTNQDTKIWVDFDNNGVFTDAAPELIWSGSSTGSGSATITNGTFTIPAGTPNGSYRMRVADRYASMPIPCNSTGWGEVHDYTVIIGPPPTCPQPTNTSSANITANSAQLSWTPPTPAPAGGYQIYYSTVATAPTAATLPNATAPASPATIAGLNPNTMYYWWVRADCTSGDVSFWTAGGSFTTTQIAGTLPYSQDFSGANDFGFANGNETNKWTVGTATGNPGQSMYISDDNGATNNYTINSESTVHAYRDLLVPAGTTLATLQFDWKGIGGTSVLDYMRVYVAPASFMPIPGTLITASATVQKIGPDYYNQATWKTELFTNVNLAPYAGQTVRLIFQWRNNTSGGTQPPSAVDNINLSVPTCQVPLNPTVTGLGTTTATLNWTAATPAPQNGYEYYYSTNPTAPTAATVPSGTSPASPVVLTGLPASTTYHWWVRSRCLGADRSYWIQGPSFTTAQIPATFPYITGFDTDNGGFTPVNATTNQWFWGMATGNPPGSMYISDDNGISNSYVVNSGTHVSSIYRDILVPAGTTFAALNFQWKAVGENCCDYLRVWLVPVSYTPTAGTLITAGAGRVQLGGNMNNQSTWKTELYNNINMSAYAGNTVRLVFQWRNDGSVGTQPPAAVDNINFVIPTCQVPVNPTVTGVGTTTATLNWNPAAPVPQNGYEYYLSTNPLPPTGATIPTGTVLAPPVVLNTLNDSTTYYWWVRSKCLGSDRSFWVEGPSFTTLQIPANFPYTTGFDTDNGGFTPVNAATNKWHWGMATGNPPGSMYISDDNGVSNTYTINTTNVSSIYRDILVPAGTTAGVLKYQWKNDGENCCDYMRVWLVPSTYTPVAGTLITAGANRVQYGGNHNDQTTWKQETHNVNLTAYAGSTVRLVFQWRNDSSVGTQPPAALDNIVFARCESTPPALTFNPITHNSATITWQQDLGGASYVLQWREVGSTTWNGPFNINALAFPATTHTFPLTGLDPATQYEVQVAAVCNGVQGAFGQEVFTTKCDPVAPSNVTFTNITSTSAVVTWDPTAGAVNYVLEYKKASDAWGSIPPIAVNGATTYTLTGLLPYTQYEVRIASNCSGDINAFSPPKVLLTRPTCEMAPVGLTVNNITMTQALVEWDIFPGATYVLRYRKVGAASWTTLSLPTNSYLITGLTEETMYEVQVANVCNGGQQAFTASYVFTTPTVQYCGMSANSASVEYISNVTVTPNGMPQMVNNSTASAYSEYITDPTKEIVLVQGSTNNQISVSKAWTGGTTYDETVSVWIDFNRNGIFETNEKILNSGANKVTPVTATFSVPNDAYVSLYNNRFMVMRVVIARDNFPMLCSNFDNGEVEDYKVRIVKGLPGNIITDEGPQIYPNPVKDELNVTKVNDGSSYKIYSAIGKLVQRGNLLYNKVNVSQLINGVYIIEVDNNGELVQKKFIKE